MEEFVVYILWSRHHLKTYVGCTSNLIARFESHNNRSKKGCTIRYRPWVVVYVKFFESKKQAMEHEKFLKTGLGREWITKHVVF
ncbi:MAG: GIY-YIG nuclease family protein [Bacteroidota bacterium]